MPKKEYRKSQSISNVSIRIITIIIIANNFCPEIIDIYTEKMCLTSIMYLLIEIGVTDFPLNFQIV